MGIRSKVLLAFLLCFGLVGWASLVLLKQRMNAEFETLERVDLVESMGRVLKVMDASAVALCRDNNIPNVVFSIREKGNLARVLAGEGTKTIVQKGA